MSGSIQLGLAIENQTATLHKFVSAAAIFGKLTKAVRSIATADLDALQKETGGIVDTIARWGTLSASGSGALKAWAEERHCDLPIGHEFGTPVASEVAEVLRKAAQNGKMKQILINDVWCWVSPNVAKSSDPSVAKEVRVDVG